MAVQSDKLRLLRRIPQIRFEEELRGYSKSQVDRVLENLAPLADEIEVLQQRLAQAEQTAANAGSAPTQASAPGPAPKPPADYDEQLREVMLMAQRTAKERVETAEADAEQIRAESKANADSLMASARNEAKELKGEAHAQREQMLADAEEERAQMLETARSETEERRAAVEAQLVESEGALRDDLLAEIKELRAQREELAADLTRFEEHLARRRNEVKAALGEIGEAIENPEKLRENDVPDAVEVSETDEAELSPIQIQSEALDELTAEATQARWAIDGAQVEPDVEPMAPGFNRLGDEPLANDFEAEEWTPPVVTPDPQPSVEAEGFSNAMLAEAAGSDDPGFSSEYVPPEPSQDYGIETEDMQQSERLGFFDTASSTPEALSGWNDPPVDPEPPQPEPAPEAPSRGGLLSGLLGGRRSNDPAPPLAPEAEPGEEASYLPPPTGEVTPKPDSTGEGMLGLRRRLAEAPFDQRGQGSPQDPGMEPFGESPVVTPASPFDSPPQAADPESRPAWAEAIPEDLGDHIVGDDLGGGASDQYLEELRRVTGEDAMTDESDEALNRFLNDPDEQGGGWFGRRK